MMKKAWKKTQQGTAKVMNERRSEERKRWQRLWRRRI